MTYCQRCERRITDIECALEWPIRNNEGQLVCPSCYGDEAFCVECGTLLWAFNDSGVCPECAYPAPLVVRDDDEAEWLNRNVLHCGHVSAGDEWDTAEAWDELDDRYLARQLLLRYREQGPSARVADWERSTLAYCCRSR
jgi:hypothetical protein